MATAAAVEFEELADPYRRELYAHCYRMLGSAHDAEDVLQEVYLRAWRGYGRFEGRSSLRTWLHRIATTACLTALEGRRRRPTPAGLGADADPAPAPYERRDVPWLEPVPDERACDPAEAASTNEGLRLALIAAMQYLPPRQRAVLLLREVLQWPAAEVAELLGTSVAAVNSALQRARAGLDAALPDYDDAPEPAEPERRELLARYVAAFERKDVTALVQLCRRDVIWEMPPYPQWYRGRDAVAHHLVHRCPGVPGGVRMLPVAANGQPAFAQYIRAEDGVLRAFNIQVLRLGRGGITRVANFVLPELFTLFDRPLVLGG